MSVAAPSARAFLSDQLQRAFHGGAWHGPSLAEAVAGVDAAAARWRPDAGSHCIAELVGHVAFWLDDTALRLGGSPRAPLAAGSDWPPAGAASDAEWQHTLATFEAAQHRLAAALEVLPEGDLDDPVAGAEPTRRGLLVGLLQHSAYHGGQISLLRRQAQASRSGP